MLGIDTGTAIDFIRWDLRLESAQNNNGHFILNIHYGLSKPNTQGFINGGQRQSFAGNYSGNNDIITLHMTGYTMGFRKINENIFHLLSSEQQLMAGNGGWSYSLSRAEPVTAGDAKYAVQHFIADRDTSVRITFEGRTPCETIAKQMKWSVSKECWKIKWLMVLNRDPQTLEPGTFEIRQTNINGEKLQGNWYLNTSAAGNILTLDIKNAGPGRQLQFLVGDENVLFFLDEQQHPLTGNSEFSFTLNRRRSSLP